MDLLDRMLLHDDWATNLLLELSLGLTDTQLDEQVDIGHRTIRATFDHIVLNVGFWTGLMTGQPIEYTPRSLSIPELIETHQRAYAIFATLSRRFRDENRLDETHVDHYDVKKSMGSTIIQVILHNAEHRTEILHILERIGFPEVPEVDHGVWDYYQLNLE